MKKLILFLAAIILATPAFASVGIKNQGTQYGEAGAINVNCPSGTVLSSDGGFTFNTTCGNNLIEAGMSTGAYVSLATIDSGVSTSYSFIRKAIDANGTTADTLPNGSPGQIITFRITTVANSGTWTLTPTTSRGFSSIAFATAGQIATLLYLDNTNGWIILSTVGTPTINDAGGV